MTIRAVVFDVGETLIDETAAWGSWADAMGIPRLTFFAVLGAIVARGGHHIEVFSTFRPGIDLRAALAEQAAAGTTYVMGAADLYPDVEPCLRALDDAGYRIVVAGNQPARTAGALEALKLPIHAVATSESLGVEKPDPRFFARAAELTGAAAAEVAYVGDRLDNDVGPAAAAGMVAIFIRRGPWGWIQAPNGTPAGAAAAIDSLAELPRVLATLR
ncbi:MAG: HAD family hydrolase [Chloroflexota bacterium]